jgi:hypothetical protein
MISALFCQGEDMGRSSMQQVMRHHNSESQRSRGYYCACVATIFECGGVVEESNNGSLVQTFIASLVDEQSRLATTKNQPNS